METINVSEVAAQLGARSYVLDLGCGEGRHTHALQWHLKGKPDTTIVGLDLAYRDLTTARSKGEQFFDEHAVNANYICASAYELPFADGQFDAVLFSEVLEHLAHDDAALAEAVRVLKPNGFLYLSVPRYWPERVCWALSSAYHQVKGGHLRIYRRASLAAKLNQLPLSRRAHYYAHALHSPYWWLRCLFWRAGDNAWPCRQYHKLLVWDLLKKPLITRTLEKLLNPIMGKSAVWHLQKTQATGYQQAHHPNDNHTSTPKEPSCTPNSPN